MNNICSVSYKVIDISNTYTVVELCHHSFACLVMEKSSFLSKYDNYNILLYLTICALSKYSLLQK